MILLTFIELFPFLVYKLCYVWVPESRILEAIVDESLARILTVDDLKVLRLFC